MALFGSFLGTFGLMLAAGAGEPALPQISDGPDSSQHLLVEPIEPIEGLSKKAVWLRDKAERPPVHVADTDLQLGRGAKTLAPRSASAEKTAAVPPVGSRIVPLVTLFNLKTREALPVLPGPRLPGSVQECPFCNLLRDHFTNQSTDMAPELLAVLTRAAQHFRSPRIDIVSGYRSPKYNLTLRKKGRQVAASSKHTVGQAVDFRVRGVPTPKLLQFVRSLRLGGVGYYPHSQFVHCDTGPIRFWRGS